MNLRCLTLAACCGVVACAAPEASANVTDAAWISSTQFNYRIRFVPDFDQRRTTLPSNGANYCVPTSVLNWAGYIARRGHPDQLPGSPPWNYAITTLNLVLLGAAMNTDPDGGTGPSGGVAGASSWLSGHAFCLVVTGNTTDGFPRLRTLANNAINANALVVPRIGWYNESNFPRITRTGGHAVSMVRAAAAGASNQLIGIHDPAWAPNGDTWSVQSAFTMNQYPVEDRVVFEGSSALPTVMSRVVGYGSGYIYGAYYIFPYVALTPVSFSFRLAVASFGAAGVQTQTISNPFRGVVTDVFQGMNLTDVFYTANNFVGPGGRLIRYSITEDEHTTIIEFGESFVDACPSRFGTIFIMDGRTLARINPNNPDNPVEASLVIGTGIDCLAYDDTKDEVVGLRPATRQLVHTQASLLLPAVQRAIPTQIPVAPGGAIDIHPATGHVLFATPASTSGYVMIPSDIAAPVVRTLTIPGNTQPITGGSFTDNGVILVAGGIMHALKQDANGLWIIDADSPFHGQPASSGKVYTPRSRTDVDRTAEDDPANADVLPFDFSGATHVRECPGDLNGDGVVNFADLNLVLTSFGQTGGNPAGDSDGDGDVDFADLNNVLTVIGVDCG